ncbi:MAG: hypothetical protein GF308_00290 [Candidatus Heimdallarchaeota archaeon]|nr:hypothetical protein [Candidatus Heimdallarchaeota archaeon]
MSLNIKNVTLYRSGIGFFSGQCTDKEFILPVNESDIDDVLKSLSIDGLKAVTFGAAEDKQNIQKKIGINIDSERAFESLCYHLIGLSVEIQTDQIHTGEVMGIDFILIDEINEEESGIDILILREAEAIRQIPLRKIKRLKILDETIKGDLEVYLDLEATTRKAGVTNLKISTLKEDASINWVIPVSAWRLSYRVQFEHENEEAIFLGIAIVDNSTSIDWEEIQLRLVTGRPLSFRYDLHTPLYVTRPWISREEQGISPILAQTAIGISAKAFSSADERLARPTTGVAREDKGVMSKLADRSIEIPVVGRTEELGAAITYLVSNPVTINRSESALIPLFSEKIKGELCVVIRDDRIDEAMDALLFKKVLELEKGVATVYIDEIFAGDAMIVRGTEYLAFRLNQDVFVIKESKQISKISKVQIRKNYLVETFSEDYKKSFRLNNQSKEPLTVLLEIAKIAGYEPTTKPTKETTNYYRYRLELPPGTTEKTYTFNKTYSKTVYIRNLGEEFVEDLIEKNLLDKKERNKIYEIFSLLRDLEKKEEEREAIEEEISNEYENQERLRENIKMLQKVEQPDVRKQYIERLKQSEKLLEDLAKESKQLQSEIQKIREKI